MAEITQLSDLYDMMMGILPDIDTPTLLQHLQDASRTFCTKTEAFREEMTPIDLVEGELVYSLAPSYDCHIKRIVEVWIRSDDDVTNDKDGTLLDTDKYKFDLPDSLTLADSLEPAADVEDGLVVKVVLVPFHLQTGDDVLSPEFLNEWYEAIMFRAFHTLMLMPKQRWTNPDLANYYEKLYLEKVTDAMNEIEMNHSTYMEGFFG